MFFYSDANNVTAFRPIRRVTATEKGFPVVLPDGNGNYSECGFGFFGSFVRLLDQATPFTSANVMFVG